MSSSTNANRSDQIRKRRTTRTQTRLEQTRSQRQPHPPITVRGAGMGQPVLQRTATRPRRVYTVAVQNTGQAFFDAGPHHPPGLARPFRACW